MEKKEFDKLVGITTAPECYERIEFVYMNSEIFSNKQQIADFYKAHDMAGIERVYKTILAHNEVVQKLEVERELLRNEIEALKQSAPLAEVTPEFIADLAAFSKTYINEIRIALARNAENIAKDTTIARLLHEYNARSKEECAEYEKEIQFAIRNNCELRPSNNCLTHSSSYRDVLYDLLKPYWEKEASHEKD